MVDQCVAKRSGRSVCGEEKWSISVWRKEVVDQCVVMRVVDRMWQREVVHWLSVWRREVVQYANSAKWFLSF